MEFGVDAASALEVTYALLGGLGYVKDEAGGGNNEFDAASEAFNPVLTSDLGKRGRLPSVSNSDGPEPGKAGRN